MSRPSASTERRRRDAVSRRVVVAGLGAAAAAPATAAAGERPNILWLVSEDNRPLIGAYGDRLARTPAIDRLAAEGVLYRAAYATAPVCAPSRFAIITGMVAQSCGPAQHMRARAKLPAEVEALPSSLRRAGYYCVNNAKTDYNCDLDPARIWDESSPDAHWRKRPRGVPFFAVFNHEATHEGQMFKVAPGAVSPADVTVPAYLPDTPEVRQDIASYYNLMEAMDRQIAARLAELEADGLAENTIVFYYSDNGGVLPRSKRHCYEEGLRCPLIVRFPPRWAHLAPGRPGSAVDTPVSFLDLAPTLLALASAPPVRQHQGTPLVGPRRPRGGRLVFSGRDRMDERYDMVRTVTDGRWRYIRNYAPHRPWGQHQAYPWQMASWRSWDRERLAGRLQPEQARFFGEKPAEELYDLREDPAQLRNRADEPAQARRLERLSRALDAHLLATHDAGFIPEGSPLEGHAESRAQDAYPIRRVVALAGRAIRRDPRHLPAFAEALSDPNEVIRYWGAQGCLMLRDRSATAAAALARMADADPSPRVRVVAAEASAHLGAAGQAVAVLTNLLSTDPDRWVRLQALNALTHVGEAARAALAAIREAAESQDQYIGSAGRYLALNLEGRYRPESRIFDAATVAR